MRMNRTLAYGLACLQYLGQNNGGNWNQVANISRCQGLPAAYCNKVLQALVHAGFVESQKGRGYRLRRDLDDISVWALMEAFTFNGAPAPEREEIPGRLYKKLREEVNSWLVGLTVQDIIEMMREEDRQKEERGRKGKCEPPFSGAAEE